MAAPRLLLIRHTALVIAPGLCYGRLDVAARPDALAAWLRVWDATGHPHQPWRGYARLLSSPAARCQVLAQALATRLALPLEASPAWQEMDFGAWEGHAWDAIGRRAVDAWAADPVRHAPGGGESALDMMRRVATAYEAWRGQGRDAILVCHGGVIRLLQAWCVLRPEGSAFGPPDLSRACAHALALSAPPSGGLVLL
ncbi:histidine phosphatase family protein [Castellaniella caeni]